MTSPCYWLSDLIILANVCSEAREISGLVPLTTSNPAVDAVPQGPSDAIHAATRAASVQNIESGIPGEYSEPEQPDGCGYRSSILLNMSPSAPADAARGSAYAPGMPAQHVKPKPGGNGFQAPSLHYVSGTSAGAVRQTPFKPGDPQLTPEGGSYSSLLSNAAHAGRPGGLTASMPANAASAPCLLAEGYAAHLAPGGPELHYKLPPVGDGYISPASRTGWPTGPALNTPANAAHASRQMVEECAVCPAEGVNIANVLATALQQMLQLVRSPGLQIGVPIPTYSGYSDKQSANDFLLALHQYELASDLSESEILRRIISVALVDQATWWYQLACHTASSMADFQRLFRKEFLPYDYKLHMRRELELWTQAPDESLVEVVQAMRELYEYADPGAQSPERVERVIQ